MMRPLKALISYEEAMKICSKHARPVEGTERVGLREASGRVLAEAVRSPMDVPPFTRAAMDGYAVRAEDTFGAGNFEPKRLKCIEAIYAGVPPKERIGPGVCAEIATGAMLPEGADGVVMVEDTERAGVEILIRTAIHPGQHTARAGEDLREGEVVVDEGEWLTPSRVGAVAAIGEPEVSVYRRPRFLVISTGSEIAALGQPLEPGQVYDINTYTLCAVIERSGGVADTIPIVSDTTESLREALTSVTDHDLVVFSAGTSVGERDIVIDVVREAGEVFFHGVALKPGKPTLFGRVGERLLLGLPGYPASCLSNAYTILAPMVRRLARLPDEVQVRIEVPMARRVVSTTGRHQFYTVKLVEGEAQPAFKHSGDITSLSRADGFIEIPANVDLVEKGELVRVTLL